MSTEPAVPQHSLARAESCYRCLLFLYPAAFRRAYEREMLLTFRACYRDLLQQGDASDRLSFWHTLCSDLITSIFSEHIRSCILLFKRLLGIERKTFMSSSLLNLDFAGLTDIGRKRAVNEDTLVSVVPQDPQTMREKGALFVVADGMGGHDKGEVASDMAVTVIRETYYQQQESDTLEALRQAVAQANRAICQRNEELFAGEQAPKRMGTTCVAAVIQGDRVYVANAGDSLAYIVRNNEVKQIAQNHSWEATQVREGKMTLEEAKAQGKSNLIYRSLGGTLDLEVYAASEQVQDGDILILCTDGLHNLVSEDEMRSIVQQYGPEESAAHLVARANEGGGPDNITAVVVHVSLAAA